MNDPRRTLGLREFEPRSEFGMLFYCGFGALAVMTSVGGWKVGVAFCLRSLVERAGIILKLGWKFLIMWLELWSIVEACSNGAYEVKLEISD